MVQQQPLLRIKELAGLADVPDRWRNKPTPGLMVAELRLAMIDLIDSTVPLLLKLPPTKKVRACFVHVRVGAVYSYREHAILRFGIGDDCIGMWWMCLAWA